MAEAALSFIGLGAQPPTPSWGAMVAEGRDLLRVRAVVSIAPGMAIASPCSVSTCWVTACVMRWMCAASDAWHDGNRIYPTHVRALRETFKALRTAEFPWTADTSI